MVQYRIGGEGLLLTRRIMAPMGSTELRVDDVVENIGPEPQPIAMLCHVNPGFPLVDEGTTVMLDGTCIVGPLQPSESSVGPVEWHVVHGPHAAVTIGAPACPAVLELSWGADTLPCLQTWRNIRRNIGVLGIEPCTAPSGAAMPVLAPGEKRRNRLALRLMPA